MIINVAYDVFTQYHQKSCKLLMKHVIHEALKKYSFPHLQKLKLKWVLKEQILYQLPVPNSGTQQNLPVILREKTWILQLLICSLSYQLT